MANVKKWGFNCQRIVFNPKEKNSITGYAIEGRHTILVDTAIMDDDIQCMHCGRTVKTGKLVFVFFEDNYVCYSPYSKGAEKWGKHRKLTFCSSSHAKLFKKNTI